MTIHDVEVLLPNLVKIGCLVLLGVVIWRFGQPLSEALGRLRRGKVAGFEIELEAVNKELAKFEVVQPLALAQIAPALTASVPTLQTEDAADADAFKTFVAALLDMASRAPEAAIIWLNVELERSVDELKSLLHTPDVMAPVKQPADALDVNRVNTIIDLFLKNTAKYENNVKRYQKIYQRLFSGPLPTADVRVRTTLFSLIDLGVSMLATAEQIHSQLLKLSEVSRRP